MMWIVFTLILSYLLGSIPTAVWIGKSYYGLDIREHGSKNAGATNTFRVLGKKPGIVVLLIDVLKGVTASLLPVLLLQGLEVDEVIKVQIGSAFLAVIGHLFPVFAGFRGGKGVATSLGVVIGILPLAAAISMVIFLIVFLSTRFVSLGAITAALLFPFILKFAVGTDSVWLLSFGVVVSSMVIVAHRKNIKRLLKGEENKMNFSRK
jgi:glycerol-3-phosphate acyltransferase PlsY